MSNTPAYSSSRAFTASAAARNWMSSPPVNWTSMSSPGLIIVAVNLTSVASGTMPVNSRQRLPSISLVWLRSSDMASSTVTSPRFDDDRLRIAPNGLPPWAAIG